MKNAYILTCLALAFSFMLPAQEIPTLTPLKKEKMKIEIWSDVMCPFCYIGKRHFEKALENFPGKENVEVTWKSFQLSPDAERTPGKDIHDYLAERKGQSRAWAKEMNDNVTAMAARAGLKYDFDRAIVANSFDAHRFSHLAKKYGKQNEAEEKLFAAYFTEGKDMSDAETLIEMGKSIGLDENEIRDMLNSEQYAADVEHDIEEAEQFGIRGVPFFVIDRKYAVSGAQPVEVFLQALEKAAAEK